MVWYSHLFEGFPKFVMIHTVKGFSIVDETEIDVFLNSLAFSMIRRVLAIWPLVTLPFLNPTWTSGSSWFIYCWSPACKILSMTLLAWEMSTTVWWFEHSLVLPFLGTGMKMDLFQSCGHHWVFLICWYIECSTLIALSFGVLNSY